MQNSRSYSFDITLMLEMYRTGKWTYKGLARYFDKDHTTIMYHVRRAGMPTMYQNIVPSKVKKRKPRVIDLAAVRYQPPVPVIPPHKPHKYDYLLYETDTIKAPKSYAVLLREAKARKSGGWYRTFAPYHGVRRIAVTEVSQEKKRSRFDAENLTMVQEELSLIVRDRVEGDGDELDTGISIASAPETSAIRRVI